MPEIKKFQDICGNCPKKNWVGGAISAVAVGALIKMRTGKSGGTDEARIYCSQHSESCPAECGCVIEGIDPNDINSKIEEL